MKPLADCRLYAFVDSAYLRGREPAELAQQMCDGGADILQLRAKDWTHSEIHEAAEAILPITRTAEVPLVINDHWALASELGAEFCHLGQEDFFEPDDDPTPELTFPGPQLGLSSHAPEQAEAALEEEPAVIPRDGHDTSLFRMLVLRCINADFGNQICIFQHFSRSTK